MCYKIFWTVAGGDDVTEYKGKEVRSMSKKPTIYKPGMQPKDSGQYGEVGPRGGLTGKEITAIAGKPLPPTSKPRHGYVLVDPTQHKK